MRFSADTAAPARALAARAEAVERSPIRLMFDLAEAHEGDDLVHLEIGEPDFDTPAHVVEAASDAARRGATHYTANAGIPELRRAVADDLAPEVEADPDGEILVTAGAMEALLLAMFTVVDPGEEIVIPTPAWPNYRTQAEMVGADVREVPLAAHEEFSLDVERMTDAIDDTTAAVVLTTPSNPTGQVYDPDAVQQVVDAVRDHDAYLIADEVYKDLVFGDHPTGIAGYTDAFDHVLTVGSCSKTFAMTGWRVGWLVGPKPVLDAANRFHESTTACASSVSQHAATAALTGPREEIDQMRRAFEERRDFVVDRVAEMPSVTCPVPDGTFYAFLDITDLDVESLELSKQLLYEYDVVTAPGAGFGAGTGTLRLSFANGLDRLELGLDRIERFLSEVRR